MEHPYPVGTVVHVVDDPGEENLSRMGDVLTVSRYIWRALGNGYLYEFREVDHGLFDFRLEPVPIQEEEEEMTTETITVFTVGDEVRITEDKVALSAYHVGTGYSGDIDRVAGAVGEVLRSDEYGSRVRVEGVATDWHYLPEMLTKVEGEVPSLEKVADGATKYKVGDRVRITSDPRLLDEVHLRPGYFTPNGGVRTIEALGTHEDSYQYFLNDHWWVNDEQIVGLVGDMESGTTQMVSQEEFRAFRATVIDVAMTAKEYVGRDGLWCEEGFKEKLEDLGILNDVYPPPPPEPPEGPYVDGEGNFFLCVGSAWFTPGHSPSRTYSQVLDLAVGDLVRLVKEDA